ncbi:MAG: type II toxin-antitoxin system Phd/YefM family antitoxin [Planctomycetota bacterium]|nr:type II toxin-antitoxin system Phd/YefM family antitoxin [Planctomycetota bacterium]
MSARFVVVSELQARTNTLLKEVQNTGEPCYITQDGKATAVLIDINRYNALMDLVEESESPRQRDEGEETRKQASVRVILKDSRRYSRA